jgi:CRISPR-associated endonuclease Cas2
LRKVEKAVSQYDVRIQKSVFEIEGRDNVIGVFMKKLEAIVKENDSIAIIPLCGKDCQKIERHGLIVPNSFVNSVFEIL